MGQRPYARRLVLCFVVVFSAQRGVSQERVAVSALSALRMQTQAIAEIWQARMSLPQSSRIGLRVQSTQEKEFTELSFVDVLQRRGYRVFSSNDSLDAVLNVYVLEQSVLYEAIESGRLRRTARVSMDATLYLLNRNEWLSLGNVSVSGIDTVSQQEDGWWQGSAVTTPPGTFERIVTPLAIIGASAVVVYLFFTVRN